jgi:nicotinamidase-related amidase
MTARLPDLRGRRAAVVTIDLHRGHLDPEVATMPLPADVAERVVEANVGLLTAARAHGLPVVHVVTSYHAVEEIASNPWWAAVAGTDATRANVLRHQLPRSPGLEVMPRVLDPDRDIVVRGKKRYDCFAATELDHVLRSRGIDTLLVTGVNTNSCVLATTLAGNTRDYAVVVVEECVDTMDRALHEAALAVIRQAFGWVATTEQVVAAL